MKARLKLRPPPEQNVWQFNSKDDPVPDWVQKHFDNGNLKWTEHGNILVLCSGYQRPSITPHGAWFLEYEAFYMDQDFNPITEMIVDTLSKEMFNNMYEVIDDTL